MFYRFVKAIIGFAIARFYRLSARGFDPRLKGAVLFVGNHPNGLIDPIVVFASTPRQVTFLAKEPLFKMPIIGHALKGIDALPVFRKQDDPSQMNRNEATFEAAANGLVEGRALLLFPEGRSHSEPSLSEIKTGAARIVQRAVKRGANVTVVPVGITYADKHRFRSEVLVECGQSFPAKAALSSAGEDDVAGVRALTEAIERGLHEVTLNLEAWEDLPLLQVAEGLYALRRGEAAGDAGRLRNFARGAQILRSEQPERLAALRVELMAFARRLRLLQARPSDLALAYCSGPVGSFIGRNLLAVFLGFPLFLAGMILFAIPFAISRWIPRAMKTELDVIATVKFLSLLVVGPVWWLGLTVGAGVLGGAAWTVGVGVGLIPLAIFTRYFLEGRREALEDARTFFVLGSRAELKKRLLAKGDRLAQELEQVVGELEPRLQSPLLK